MGETGRWQTTAEQLEDPYQYDWEGDGSESLFPSQKIILAVVALQSWVFEILNGAEKSISE